MAKPDFGSLISERMKHGSERFSEQLNEEGIRASTYIDGSAALLLFLASPRTTEDADRSHTGEVHRACGLAFAAIVAREL